MKNKTITPGIADEEFIRGKVPMTKQEIRAASVCKLHLQEDSVVYDVGCGTGSVSVEIARLSPKIKVFSVDSNPEAVELTKKNAEKFGLKNIEVLQGEAPQVLENLPKPTHAFIGGSGGKLEEIIKSLCEKNPEIRIVINAVTLESITKVGKITNQETLKDCEVVQFFITKSQKVGNYNLLKAENPVFVCALEFGKEGESL